MEHTEWQITVIFWKLSGRGQNFPARTQFCQHEIGSPNCLLWRPFVSQFWQECRQHTVKTTRIPQCMQIVPKITSLAIKWNAHPGLVIEFFQIKLCRLYRWIILYKNGSRTYYLLCKRQKCQHCVSMTQAKERIFKLLSIHVLVICQILQNLQNASSFRKNSNQTKAWALIGANLCAAICITINNVN